MQIQSADRFWLPLRICEVSAKLSGMAGGCEVTVQCKPDADYPESRGGECSRVFLSGQARDDRGQKVDPGLLYLL